MRRLLLIALPSIAMSLSACANLSVHRSQSGEEKAAADRDAGNDSSDGGNSARGKLEACSQITREEVEAALGKPVTEPVRNELVSPRAGMLTSSCMFAGDQGFVSLNVRQRAPGSATAWDAARSFEELKDLIFKGGGREPSIRLEEVTGLGADAFAETMEETVNYETTALRVLSKRTILTIRVNAPASTPTLEAAKMLAGKAIPRLERDEGRIVVAEAPPPRPAAKPDDAERPKGPEGPPAERKGEKRVERSTAPKASEAATARGGKGVARPAREPSSKVSQKSASRTADRGKKEVKTPRPNPRNRKRS